MAQDLIILETSLHISVNTNFMVLGCFWSQYLKWVHSEIYIAGASTTSIWGKLTLPVH